MPTLTYTPSVYNLSCHWSRAAPVVLNNVSSSNSASPLPSPTGLPPELASFATVSGYDFFRCIAALAVTCGLICGNLILAVAVNNKYTTGILQFQTRCLLTSIATNHVATGLLVTVWNIYPSLTECWPYGVLLCQIQAVLFGALSQHNAILWILVALDRFIFATKRRRYLLLASSKLCVWVVGATWSLSFAYYTSIVLPYSAFDYRNEGLAGCEPVPQMGVLKLVSTCLLYFPTTMTLLYVYGTVFHSRSGSHHGRSSSTTTPTRLRSQGTRTPIPVKTSSFDCGEQCSPNYCNVKLEESVTRSMATMSLAFIINSTPWIIKQIIIACLGNEVVPWLDFVITWSFLSLGVWNPLLCWLLCPPIRDGVRHVLSMACVCCYSNNYSQPARRSSTWATEISTLNGVLPQCEIHPNAVAEATVAAIEQQLKPHPNSPASGAMSPNVARHQRHPHSIRGQQQTPTPLPPPPPPPRPTPRSVPVGRSAIAATPDSIEHDERVWGEILERSLSSGSLHHLKRFQCRHDDDDDRRHQNDEEAERRGQHSVRPSGKSQRSLRANTGAVDTSFARLPNDTKRRSNGNPLGSGVV